MNRDFGSVQSWFILQSSVRLVIFDYFFIFYFYFYFYSFLSVTYKDSESSDTQVDARYDVIMGDYPTDLISTTRP